MSFKQTISLLKKLDVKPSKKLGQNFVVDKNLISKIILNSDLSTSEIILEVGAGLGTLTKELLKQAKKVISYEIDRRLYKYLTDELSDYDNLELINADVLKSKLPYYDKVVSNIPYTISGPLLEKLFYTDQPRSGTLIIEKSISDKLCDYQKYQNYSRVSVTFNAFMNCLSTDEISQNCFFPVPKIRLSLIKIKPREDLPSFLNNTDGRKFFIHFVSKLTQYKNKSLSNAIALYLKNENLSLSKSDIKKLLNQHNISENKLFLFDVDTLVKISKIFHQLKNLDDVI